jgi:3',5'-cyclic AMP phosphodiesterase CpdA
VKKELSILFTADLHLTPDPKNLYRWRIFKFLESQLIKYGPDVVVLGGDLTDNKDEHPSWLVNNMVRGIEGLAQYCPVIILRGNHDYVEEAQPFFDFITQDIDRGNSYVQFVKEPTGRTIGGYSVLFLPNTRHHEEDWKGIDFNKFDYIFCHQTFDGSLSENGTKLGGIPPSVFGKTKARVYAGDIHKPQRVGKTIEHVGSPYRMRFGDEFTPRVLLIQRSKFGEHSQTNLYPDGMMKHVIDLDISDPVTTLDVWFNEGMNWAEGDQVKVRVTLDRADIPSWPKIKSGIQRVAKKYKVELFGPELKMASQGKAIQGKRGAQARRSPAQALDSYAKSQGLSKGLLAAGQGFLDEATGHG